MRTIAPWRALAPVLAIALSSCVQKRPLPTPLPPPAPPEYRSPSPPTASPPAKKDERTSLAARKPSFSVTMMEKSGAEPRKLAGEQSTKAVNFLVQMGYDARVAREVEDLPVSRTEAALKAPQGAQPGDLFLYGEIIRGPTNEVKVTAVDPREGKIIDDKGFRSPTAAIDDITRKAIEAVLPTVETYWKIRN